MVIRLSLETNLLYSGSSRTSDSETGISYNGGKGGTRHPLKMTGNPRQNSQRRYVITVI